jgi:large subunit ribosomal protein L22
MAQVTQQRERRDPILSKIRDLEEADRRKVIKTRARKARVREEYVGHTLGIFNGDGYTNVHVTREMIGQMLGKLAPRVTPTAQARYLSIPPRKMRLVGDLIQGLPVEEALNILNFTPKIAAFHMAKVLKSAAANKLSIEGTSNLQAEDLRVARVVVSPGPTAKRIQYRSMGRVYRIRKRFCHLAIYLEVSERKRREEEAEARAEARKASGKKAPAKRKTAKKKTAKKKTAKKKTAKKTAAKKKTTAKKSTAKKTTAKKTATKKTATKKTATKKTASKKADDKPAKKNEKK